jgi:hypothetical protein
MTDIRVVTVELRGLADDLRRTAEDVVDEMKPVVSKGALNIKKDWAKAWKGLGPHISDLPRTIDYDLAVDQTTISADIGPNKDLVGTQAPLSNLIEFGSVHSAAHPAGATALALEESRFVQAVGDAAEKLLGPR